MLADLANWNTENIDEFSIIIDEFSTIWSTEGSYRMNGKPGCEWNLSTLLWYKQYQLWEK